MKKAIKANTHTEKNGITDYYNREQKQNPSAESKAKVLEYE